MMLPKRLCKAAAFRLLCCATAVSAQTRVDRTLSVPPAAAAPVNALPAPTSAPPAATPTYHPPASPARHRRSGSYSSEAMGPAITAKNADYETAFKVSTPVPPGSRISRVSWKYGVSLRPAGFEAILCWHGRELCWNITNNTSGDTVAFNGKDAGQALSLHYRVKGGGQLGPPARGEMNQIIVTYDLPG